MSDEMQNKTEETKQTPIREKSSGYLFYIVIAVLMLLVLGLRVWWTHSFGVVEVDGQSMMRTLEHGDELLMQFVRDGKGLKRGDVIVVKTSHYEEVKDVDGNQIDFLIKRLIAVEGDKVKCKDGQIEICYAGTSEYLPLDEPYAYYDGNMTLYDFQEYVVEEGEIFFLGDNRLHSHDSRYKDGGSHLNDLYKVTDVYGVVPEWAIEHKEVLGKIFNR